MYEYLYEQHTIIPMKHHFRARNRAISMQETAQFLCKKPYPTLNINTTLQMPHIYIHTYTNP